MYDTTPTANTTNHKNGCERVAQTRQQTPTTNNKPNSTQPGLTGNREQNRRYQAENKTEIAEQTRRYRAENKTEIAEQRRQHYEANKDVYRERHSLWAAENKAELAEYSRRYQAENKTKIAEQRRQHYEANSEKLRERSRLWTKANPEKNREAQRRYLRRRGGKKPRRYADQIAARDGGWFCTYCCALIGAEYEIDHRHPVSRAGTYAGEINELDNLCLACPSCNHQKGAHTAEEFAEYLRTSDGPVRSVL